MSAQTTSYRLSGSILFLTLGTTVVAFSNGCAAPPVHGVTSVDPVQEGKLPQAARLLAEGEGALAITAPADGQAFLFGENENRIECSFTVKRNDRIELNDAPTGSGVPATPTELRVNGIPVYTRAARSAGNRIYFVQANPVASVFDMPATMPATQP